MYSLRGVLLGTALISMTLLVGLTAARADIKFCSQFDRPIFVAMAYPQTYSDGSTGYVSRGWLRVDKGDCQEFDTSLHVPYFFYRGETDWYQIKGGRRRDTWGDDANKFMTTVASFNFWDADQKANSSSTTPMLGFTKSIISDDGDISETVTFQADGVHTVQSLATGGTSPK